MSAGSYIIHENECPECLHDPDPPGHFYSCSRLRTIVVMGRAWKALARRLREHLKAGTQWCITCCHVHEECTFHVEGERDSLEAENARLRAVAKSAQAVVSCDCLVNPNRVCDDCLDDLKCDLAALETT